MQLERDHPGAEDGALSQPLRLSRRALPPLTVRAFGQNVTLRVTADEYLRDDSYWRLRSIYEPALAAQTMAPTGTALDIGAGYGCFTIPFALLSFSFLSSLLFFLEIQIYRNFGDSASGGM